METPVIVYFVMFIITFLVSLFKLASEQTIVEFEDFIVFCLGSIRVAILWPFVVPLGGLYHLFMWYRNSKKKFLTPSKLVL